MWPFLFLVLSLSFYVDIFVCFQNCFCNGPVPAHKISQRIWVSLRPIWQNPRAYPLLSYKKRCSLPFCLITNLKRSSAENSRRPKTLAVELSLLLSCAASLSSLSPARRSLSLLAVALSLSSPSPSLSPRRRTLSLSPSRRRREVVVLTRSQPPQILVSRSRSRSKTKKNNVKIKHGWAHIEGLRKVGGVVVHTRLPIGDVANPHEYGGVKGVIGLSWNGKMSRISLGFDVCGNE
ncbi:hypothetical protein YC2023_122386 [Brassica napus]